MDEVRMRRRRRRSSGSKSKHYTDQIEEFFNKTICESAIQFPSSDAMYKHHNEKFEKLFNKTIRESAKARYFMMVLTDGKGLPGQPGYRKHLTRRLPPARMAAAPNLKSKRSVQQYKMSLAAQIQQMKDATEKGVDKDVETGEREVMLEVSTQATTKCNQKQAPPKIPVSYTREDTVTDEKLPLCRCSEPVTKPPQPYSMNHGVQHDVSTELSQEKLANRKRTKQRQQVLSSKQFKNSLALRRGRSKRRMKYWVDHGYIDTETSSDEDYHRKNWLYPRKRWSKRILKGIEQSDTKSTYDEGQHKNLPAPSRKTRSGKSMEDMEQGSTDDDYYKITSASPDVKIRYNEHDIAEITTEAADSDSDPSATVARKTRSKLMEDVEQVDTESDFGKNHQTNLPAPKKNGSKSSSNVSGLSDVASDDNRGTQYKEHPAVGQTLVVKKKIGRQTTFGELWKNYSLQQQNTDSSDVNDLENSLDVFEQEAVLSSERKRQTLSNYHASAKTIPVEETELQSNHEALQGIPKPGHATKPKVQTVRPRKKAQVDVNWWTRKPTQASQAKLISSRKSAQANVKGSSTGMNKTCSDKDEVSDVNLTSDIKWGSSTLQPFAAKTVLTLPECAAESASKTYPISSHSKMVSVGSKARSHPLISLPYNQRVDYAENIALLKPIQRTRDVSRSDNNVTRQSKVTPRLNRPRNPNTGKEINASYADSSGSAMEMIAVGDPQGSLEKPQSHTANSRNRSSDMKEENKDPVRHTGKVNAMKCKRQLSEQHNQDHEIYSQGDYSDYTPFKRTIKTLKTSGNLERDDEENDWEESDKEEDEAGLPRTRGSARYRTVSVRPLSPIPQSDKKTTHSNLLSSRPGESVNRYHIKTNSKNIQMEEVRTPVLLPTQTIKTSGNLERDDEENDWEESDKEEDEAGLPRTRGSARYRTVSVRPLSPIPQSDKKTTHTNLLSSRPGESVNRYHIKTNSKNIQMEEVRTPVLLPTQTIKTSGNLERDDEENDWEESDKEEDEAGLPRTRGSARYRTVSVRPLSPIPQSDKKTTHTNLLSSRPGESVNRYHIKTNSKNIQMEEVRTPVLLPTQTIKKNNKAKNLKLEATKASTSGLFHVRPATNASDYYWSENLATKTSDSNSEEEPHDLSTSDLEEDPDYTSTEDLTSETSDSEEDPD